MKKLIEYMIIASFLFIGIGLTMMTMRWAGIVEAQLWRAGGTTVFGGAALLMFSYVLVMLFVKEKDSG